MKKLIALCLFAFVMVLGTTTATAQNKLEINKIAAKKAEFLRLKVKFDENQHEKVYEAFERYETLMYGLSNNANQDLEAKQKANAFLDEKMEGILNREQYNIYKKTPIKIQ